MTRLKSCGSSLLIMTLLFSCCLHTDLRAFGGNQHLGSCPIGLKLENLRPGQSLSYYLKRFEEMGYTVEKLSGTTEQKTYDLRKGDERAVVMLTISKGSKVRKLRIQRNKSQNGGCTGMAGRYKFPYNIKPDEWPTV